MPNSAKQFKKARFQVKCRHVSFALIVLNALFILQLLSNTCRADFQGSTHMVPFDEGTLNYTKGQPAGPVARLQQQIDKGEVKLKHDADYGYLLSVLEALKIPRSSQALVFSKTSFQRERISPTTPRALYFNDDVYIGFIPGSPLMEISMADPKLGAVFYTLDQTKTDKPKLTRNDQCLECHASAKTMGVPGHLLRSLITDENGVADLNTGASEVNHRTPLAERWGGWYVTGTHGSQVHRGNLFGKTAFDRQEKEPNYLGNQTNLDRFLTVANYAQPTSDIVALMVLEHQVHMHNFVARLNDEAILTLQAYGHIRYLKTIEEAFLKYLLFTEEAPLTAPVKGTASFTQAFENLGPRDHLGRSLRQFDLQTRIFKYPCSYLIYSESFDRLPDKLKQDLYQRLWNILTGKDESPEFQKIPLSVRQAILEILIETKPGLPDYWESGK
ncbi:MAG: hypothetical protein JWQ71_233 [Pedosphaera sp.]|nr:hypothetical protein [Pedosphaera sp.]